MSEISEDVKESLSLVEDLKFFLATAPANWQENQVIRRYYLNNDEGFVSCVFWNNLYFITGTDIVRCILYKFQHFGRTVTDRKKFEEGIFSDLRNLKAGTDSVLENPKSEFLEFLYKNSCLRTQKKQKVFFWFNVPHDKLMADALERDIKKEKANQPATSVASREPALSFNYVEDKTKSLYDQLSEHLAQSKFETVKQEDLSETGSPEYNTSGAPTQDNSDPAYTSQTLDSDYIHQSGQQQQQQQQQHQPGDAVLKHADPGSDVLGNANRSRDEDDDDFPLDYLDQEFPDYGNSMTGGMPGAAGDWAGRDYAGRDYITLDSHHHSGAYINAFDSDFDNLDTSVFQNSVNLVSNDDYLIEQTVPARPGTLTSPSQLFYPRSAKVFDDQAYVYPPMGFAPGPQYPPSSVMTSFAPFPYESSGYHPHDAPSIYPHFPFENEYLHPQLTPIGAMHSMVHMDQPGTAYGYPEDMDYLMRSGIPSQRQQDASASMMRKRRQLSNNNTTSKIAKPQHRGSSNKLSDYESKLRVQIKKEEEMSVAIPTPGSSIQVATYNSDHSLNNKSM